MELLQKNLPVTTKYIYPRKGITNKENDEINIILLI